MTGEFIFDTAKPIFILEVINVISEAAKEQEMSSTFAKLAKGFKPGTTLQSDAYGETLTPAQITALLASTNHVQKNGLNNKGGIGSRGL